MGNSFSYANASHIIRTGYKTVIGKESSNEESPLAYRNGTLMALIFMIVADVGGGETENTFNVRKKSACI